MEKTVGEMARWGAGSVSRRSPGFRRTGPLVTLSGLAGALTTIVALSVGVVLAVLFAATLAVVTVLAAVLLALTALALRARPERRPVPVRARRQSWIAYSWDRHPR